jgi:hypothetical protein
VLQENEHIQSMTVLEAVRVYSAAYPHPRDPFETLELVGLTEEVGSRIGDALGRATSTARRNRTLRAVLVGMLREGVHAVSSDRGEEQR